MAFRKLKFIILCLFFSGYSPHTIIAQQHDYSWLFGYGSNPDFLDWGGSVMEFMEDTINTYYEYRDMNFDYCNASMCDTSGNLLFYTNGIYIANALGDTMMNGGGISPCEFMDNFSYFGSPIVQGVLILPNPENDRQYYVIHEPYEYPTPELDWHAPLLYYSLVDMTLDNGLGAVLEKNQIIFQDTLDHGKITATRHANGRDWWVLALKHNSNCFRKLLISPEGVQDKGMQCLGAIIPHGIGQAVFAPDGSKYVTLSRISSTIGNYLNIYDFDRCAGLLSNPIQEHFIDGSSSGGVAISPNSRFLYNSAATRIYQYDLQSIDIIASKDTVAEYDGYLEESLPGFFQATRFSRAQIGPDGKIYICCAGALKSMHVINQPDSLGVACEVLQHHIQLPTLNSGSLPNHPNYRLGALEGSPCDTIPVPAPPTAFFTCAPDTLNGFSYQFLDASSDNTNTWLWSFGDDSTSAEINPVHLYAENGSYEVCLIASNDVGSDTICKTIEIQVVGTNEIAYEGLSVFPNPVKTILYFSHAEIEYWDKLELLDMTGRVVRRYYYDKKITMKNLAPGIYLLRLWKDHQFWTRKVVKY